MNAAPDSVTRLAVLASGNGSNLQAILRQIAAGALPATAAMVISDVHNARALQRADAAGVPSQVIAPGDFPDKHSWNEAIAAALESAGVDLIVLAGFMRILGQPVLARFAGRVLNVHPSLLPRYPGLKTYQRVLAAGDKEHGSSVHFVTEQLDGGPVIAQVVLPILGNDDALTLQGRVVGAEHWLYPLVIRWFVSGRIEMRGSRVWLDGRALGGPVRFAGSDPE